MSVKPFIIEKIEPLINKDSQFKLLDLGSGTSKNFLPLIKNYPNFQYIGIEPNPKEAAIACRSLTKFKRAKVVNDFAYNITNYGTDFDLCISLSVLEHIKNLSLFLKNSVSCVKPGGQIIHLYDLGHALYPHSLKERFQVFLGNNFPKLLPETKFVRYLDENEVVRILKDSGAEINIITYHQMPNHKQFLKEFEADNEEKKALLREIFAWEFRVSPFLRDMEQKQRELLFPSVCIWARKR